MTDPQNLPDNTPDDQSGDVGSAVVQLRDSLLQTRDALVQLGAEVQAEADRLRAELDAWLAENRQSDPTGEQDQGGNGVPA